MNPSDILKIAALAGEIMLENGAETYRVEDTINRICSVSPDNVHYNIETFVTPTGIFISIDDNKDHPLSIIKRIKTRTTNLEKVTLVNKFSREYVDRKIDLNLLHLNLKAVKEKSGYNNFIHILFTGIGSGFSTLVFGGALINFPFSFIIGILLGLLLTALSKTSVYDFISTAMSAAFVCILSLLCVKYLPFKLDLDKIIIGCIMPMAPGVAITNAVRDYMYGDLVSGTSRAAEAFMIAVSIAVGAGIILKIGL
jgi:uncharacterized membrane protein YjjP (DUF1212 family)